MTVVAARNVPNFLSLMRLGLAPLTVWLASERQWDATLWVFALAAVTDGLDGFLARVMNARTVLGMWLDPLADKALAVCIYMALAISGNLPLWLAVLVVLRDVLIIFYAALDFSVGKPPAAPLLLSKINTVAQIVLACLVLARLGPGWGSAQLTEAFVVVVAVTTVASGAAYLLSTFQTRIP